MGTQLIVENVLANETRQFIYVKQPGSHGALQVDGFAVASVLFSESGALGRFGLMHTGAISVLRLMFLKERTTCNWLLLRTLPQNLFSEVIADRGLVVEHFEVGIFQELGVVLT